MPSLQQITEFLVHYWPKRKTRYGLSLILVLLVVAWSYLIFEKNFSVQSMRAISLIFIGVAFVFVPAWYLFSGRILLPMDKFTVVLSLRSHNVNSTRHINSTLYLLRKRMDEAGLLPQVRIILVGEDVFSSRVKVHKYRERFDVELIIWGDVIAGNKTENNQTSEAHDFKNLSFTCKIPETVCQQRLQKAFMADMNISLIDRDWSLYEINSLPDVEKIHANLYEIIMFLIGVIYAQEKEYVESSVTVLELLFRDLSLTVADPDFSGLLKNKEVAVSPAQLRKGRILAILTAVYNHLGTQFVEQKEFSKASFYLKKYCEHKPADPYVLSRLALSSFYLGNVVAAEKYTDDIGRISKAIDVFNFNKAFFAILRKDYSSVLSFYRAALRKGRKTGKGVTTSVIAFLDERRRETNNEFAYDFAIGLLNHEFCDRTVGKKELQLFINETSGKAEYAEMARFASSHLSQRQMGRKRRGNKKYQNKR